MGWFSRKTDLKNVNKEQYARRINKTPDSRRVRKVKRYVEKKLNKIEWRLSRINAKLYYLPGLNDAEKLLFANARKKAGTNIQQVRSLLKEIRNEMDRIRT